MITKRYNLNFKINNIDDKQTSYEWAVNLRHLTRALKWLRHSGRCI